MAMDGPHAAERALKAHLPRDKPLFPNRRGTVKRILFALGVTGLAICAGRLLAPQAFAQQPLAPQGAVQGMPGLRVATINVGLVFTKYAKAAKFKADMETQLAPHRAEGAKLKKEII